MLFRLAGARKNRKNACRLLHHLVHRTPGMTVHIPVDTCLVRVRLRKPVRFRKSWWPMLRMDSWVKWFLANKPQLLLGGSTVSSGEWRNTFTQFWSDYRRSCPNHPLFSTDFNLAGCIPFTIHGDEGRGQVKRPFMVLTWQPVISHLGPVACNHST